MHVNKIYNENCLKGLINIPDKSIHCCVTSPPYFGLRDYGHGDQIGLEETPELYVQKLVHVFNEVKRVLKDDGTLWLNLGDSYNNYKANTGDTPFAGNVNRPVSKQGLVDTKLKVKDLIGIPWMVAFALRSAGWYLRQDIIWHKPNPMPESVTDRCTKAHEYIFLLSKSKKYYCDMKSIKQPMAASSVKRLSQDIENQEGIDRVPNKTNGKMKAVGWKEKKYDQSMLANKQANGSKGRPSGMAGYREEGFANKRSVWKINTMPYSEAHFATFPEDLIVDCIKAGCPLGGVVLDPFMGAGTTALVARKLNRNYLGFEINPQYLAIANSRLRDQLGMFL